MARLRFSLFFTAAENLSLRFDELLFKIIDALLQELDAFLSPSLKTKYARERGLLRPRSSRSASATSSLGLQ